MPYIPLRNGESIFVEDPDEAQQRYEQEWNQKEEAPAPQAQQKPEEPKQQQEGFDVGGFLKQQATGLKEQVKGAVKTAGLTAVAGPFAPMVAGALAAQKVPGKEEAGRVVINTPREIVNDVVARSEEATTLTKGALPAGLLGGPMTTGDVQLDKQREEEQRKSTEAAVEIYMKSGMTPEGFSYGIKPSTPLIGPLFSEDSEFVQQYVKPKTALGQFASDVAQAMLADVGISKLIQGPSMVAKATRAAKGFDRNLYRKVWKTEDIKNGLSGVTRFLLEDAVPGALTDLVWLAPKPTVQQQKKFENTRKLLTTEERLASTKAIVAQTPEEFNFAYENLVNIGGGLGAAAGIRTLMGLKPAFTAANSYFRSISMGVDPQKALDDALDIAEPLARQEIQEYGVEKAFQMIEGKIGDLNVDLYKRIDETVPKIAANTREGAETSFQAASEYNPELERLIKIIDELPDVSAEKGQVDAGVEFLQNRLNIKTVEDFDKKRANLEARLASYEEVMARDPEWINKSTGKGKKASKNSTKLRMVNEALEALDEYEMLLLRQQQFANNNLEKQARIEELGAVVAKSRTAFNSFIESLSSAREMLNGLDEIDAERVKFLEAKNFLLTQENRLEEVSTDLQLDDAFGEVYNDLKNLVSEAEIAVVSDDFDPDFMSSFVARVDEAHDKLIANGGTAPVVPQVPEGVQLPEQAQEGFVPPRQPAPVVNEVPIRVTDEKTVEIDSDAQEIGRQATEFPNNEVAQTEADITNAINKERKQYLNPAEKSEFLDDWLRGVDETLEKQKQLTEFDAANGTNLAQEATEIYNTNAVKYGSNLQSDAAIKAGVDLLDTRDADLLKGQYALALKKLATTLGDDSDLRKMALLIEGEEFGEDVKKNLHKVMIVTAMLDDSAINALQAAREFKRVNADSSISAVDRTAAFNNFRTNSMVFMQNIKAIGSQFEGIGNALRLFSREARLDYDSAGAEQLFGEFNRQMAGFGDAASFAEQTSKAARNAKEELDNLFGDFFLKEGKDLTDEDFNNFNNLVDQVYKTGGDLSKMKDLEITAPAVLRGIQSGGMISAPHTLASIPIMGYSSAVLRSLGLAGGGYVTAAGRMLLRKNPTVVEEAFRRADLELSTIRTLHHYFGLSLKNAYNSFVFGRSITDPKQAKQMADELPKTLGLTREQAILDDLQATKIEIPFVKRMYERSLLDDKTFDTLNKGRVFSKAFWDYGLAGDRQQYRGAFGKYVLAPMTTGISNLQRTIAGGPASFYPGGEHVNFSLPFRLSAAGDELVVANWANARQHAKAEADVNSMIGMGLIDPEDRAEKIKEVTNAYFKELYQPVKVGVEQKEIGTSIQDKQYMEFMRTVAQTEELTGGLKDVKEAINQLRYSDNPLTSAIANDLAGVVTSPLVGIKQVIAIAAGGEIASAGYDAVRLGYKNIANKVIKAMSPKDTQKLVEFESKYFSSDPDVAFKARGALALSVGLHASVFFMVNDGNQDITGGLENSYRESEGKVPMFTWKVGGVRIPYRYFPPLGDVIAMHTVARDMRQHGVSNGNSELFSLGVGLVASYIMETPGLAGLERAMKALEAAGRGDVNRLSKLLSGSFTRGGDPYVNARKVIAEGIDPRKPASATTRFTGSPYYKRNDKNEILGKTPADLGVGFLNAVADSIPNTFGLTAEYSPLRPVVDTMVSIAKDEPRLRSRKALWYGKPGEAISANHAGVWYPLQAILGRYWPFPDKLEGDPVAEAIVYNMISPPKTSSFHSYGIGMDQTGLNDFAHFLNSEFQYRDDDTGKEYVGMYDILYDIVTSSPYKDLPGTDSPYKMPALLGENSYADWDRTNNARRTYLADEVRKLMEKAKDQFVYATNPGQRYKLPAEMLEYVEARNAGLTN